MSATTTTTTTDESPRRTAREKLVEVSDLIVDHVLALLKNAEPGTLNAYSIKTCLELLKGAGLSPVQADEEREKAKRAAAMSVPFGGDDDQEAPATAPLDGRAESAGRHYAEDFDFPYDPTVPEHMRGPEPKPANGTAATAAKEGATTNGHRS